MVPDLALFALIVAIVIVAIRRKRKQRWWVLRDSQRLHSHSSEQTALWSAGGLLEGQIAIERPDGSIHSLSSLIGDHITKQAIELAMYTTDKELQNTRIADLVKHDYYCGRCYMQHHQAVQALRLTQQRS